MRKISRREIIVIIVAVIALLYGIYEFYPRKAPEVTASGDHREHALQQTNALVAAVSGTLKEAERAIADSYIVEMAGKEWTRDPFFVGMTSPVEQVESGEDMITESFVYTGYLEMGTRQMAIINGIDYQVGDALEEPGFVLQSVTPRHVVIEYERGGREIVVPFVEE
ncbi:MAG: hypothetical protein PHU03_02260 [Syntrophales bacterium]|nr:hypothetical protein [Syntrophales bacterium]